MRPFHSILLLDDSLASGKVRPALLSRLHGDRLAPGSGVKEGGQ
jgi:hypothetical protein